MSSILLFLDVELARLIVSSHAVANSKGIAIKGSIITDAVTSRHVQIGCIECSKGAGNHRDDR